MRLFLLLALVSPLTLGDTALVKVKGMVCAFCSQGLTKKFSKETSVEKVNVSLDDKSVTLVFRENQSLSDPEIQSLIESAGFTVVSITRDDRALSSSPAEKKSATTPTNK